jgi:predicted  nucleic acid-binding Zn-ribbon protein
MAKPKSALTPSEETLEQLLDKVSNAREELVAIERTLERLKADITKVQKQKDGARKKR